VLEHYIRSAARQERNKCALSVAVRVPKVDVLLQHSLLGPLRVRWWVGVFRRDSLRCASHLGAMTYSARLVLDACTLVVPRSALSCKRLRHSEVASTPQETEQQVLRTAWSSMASTAQQAGNLGLTWLARGFQGSTIFLSRSSGTFSSLVMGTVGRQVVTDGWLVVTVAIVPRRANCRPASIACTAIAVAFPLERSNEAACLGRL